MSPNKGKKGKRSVLSMLMLLINLVLVLVLIVSYLAAYTPPDRFWPLVFFGLAYPAILLLNLAFMVYWLIRLKAWFLVSFFTILLGLNHFQAYFKFSGKDDIPDDARHIKVMSFNVRYFDRYNWVHGENEITRKEIFQMLREESPGIICFQEFYTDMTPAFNTVDSLAKAYGYPYYHTHYALVKARRQSYGSATFSRYPIVKREVFRFTNNIYNYAIISDIVVKSDTFRVINVHFESIRLSEEDRLFLNDLTRQVGEQGEIVSKYRKIFHKIRFASELRASQVREIRKLVEESPYPVIVCTDLNDTPASYAYRQLTRNLRDAFSESGSGLGNTYIGFLPAFRIDFILYDPVFESRGYQKIPKHLSDHYPIVTNLIY